jgi:hypothetical protein
MVKTCLNEIRLDETRSKQSRFPQFHLVAHVRRRLRQWLCEKHGMRWPGTKRFPDAYINDGLGLVRLPRLTRTFPWAKA